MATFRFDKLVRDKVLQRCLDDPKVRTEYKTLTDIDFKQELLAKIHEEASEIPVASTSDDEVLSELADVQAVLDALRDAYGISSKELEAAQLKKFEKNGGFNDKAYIFSVDLDDDSEWNEYFRAQPDKYKEVQAEENSGI